ncbi:MAG: siroheme synthase [Myxococcaceae bacterium]|nr:siroheme synthase [Myxococcaceae bacterium]
MHPEEIQAFPVALNLAGRSVLVVGGSEEALQKVPKLILAGAAVTIVAPSLAEPLQLLARHRVVTWYVRDFVPTDVRGAHLVMLTEIEPRRAEQLRALARVQGFWLCAIDQPAWSDFFLVSTVVAGPIQLSISSSGKAPLLARRMREALELALDAKFAVFAHRFAALRARVRAVPRVQRSEILKRALDGFAMDVRLSYPEGHGQGVGDPPEDARDP